MKKQGPAPCGTKQVGKVGVVCAEAMAMVMPLNESGASMNYTQVQQNPLKKPNSSYRE